MPERFKTILLNPESPKCDKGCYYFFLKGKTPDNRSYTFEIRNVPQDSILLRIDDSFPPADKLLKEDGGIRERADYAIISEKNNNRRILIIEISAANKPDSYIKRQLRGGICVLEYCSAVYEKFYSGDKVLKEFQIHYAGIKDMKGQKYETAFKKSSRDNVKIDNFSKIPIKKMQVDYKCLVN